MQDIHHKRKAGIVWFDKTLFPYIDVIEVNKKRCEYIQRIIQAFKLLENLDIVPVKMCSRDDLESFHIEGYIDALKSIENCDEDDLELYGLKDDCAPFEGLWEYARLIAGSTLMACRYIIENTKEHGAPIAINWMGGRHHAKKDEASGFCFVNDVSIGIIQLLKFFNKIICIDIDIHHGDGVEESFYFSQNVLTLSFHMKEHGFFPGTGDIGSIGSGKGKYHNINIPLREGVDDSQYLFLFETITSLCMKNYQPECIVLVCGADMLKGDPLGGFNLSLRGVEQCIRLIKSFYIPTLILGGGGYHWPNVTRLAAITTATLTDTPISESIPIFDDKYTVRDTYYLPSSNIRVNKNSDSYIKNIISQTVGHLQRIAPS